MSNSKLILAKGFAGAALLLALVDAIWSSFLPIDVATGGIVFGLSTISFSTAAFFISLSKRSHLVAALLIASGIVITTHGVIETRNLTIIYIPGPILGVMFGVWVLALGIVKSIKTSADVMSTPAK
jgi:hypothetical protein